MHQKSLGTTDLQQHHQPERGFVNFVEPAGRFFGLQELVIFFSSCNI